MSEDIGELIRNLNFNIKKWYQDNYPTDDVGETLNENATFLDLNNLLYSKGKGDVYVLLGGEADSLVRERVFQKLSEIKNVPYSEIYDKWLGLDDTEENKELDKNSEVKVYSAICVGGYNDILCYDVEIGLDGKKETISLEKHYHDLQKPNVAWEIKSNIELNVIDIEKIIKTVSQELPAIYSDIPPKQYEQEKEDEIEMDDEIVD